MLAGCGGVTLPVTTSVQARALLADTPPSTPNDGSLLRIILTWEPPTTAKEDAVIEYHVWRDDDLVGVAAPSQRVFVDGAAPRPVTYQQPSAAGALESRTLTPTPMPLYTPMRYRVSFLARFGSTVEERPLLPTDTIATAIWYPSVDDAPLFWRYAHEKVGFNFLPVVGANRYVAELSTTADFESVKTLGPVSFTSSPETRVSYVFRGTIDLVALFPRLQAPTSLYLRVGARNAQDSPDASGKLSYLYSPPVKVTVEQAPSLPFP